LKRALAAALGLCCLLSQPLQAQDEDRLGEPGQWLLGGSAGASLQFGTERVPRDWAGPLQRVDHSSLWLSPMALLFVATDFAMGAQLSFGLDHYERDDRVELDETSFGGGLLLAYRIGLGARVFLLPELGIGAEYHDRSVNRPPGVREGNLAEVIARTPVQWRFSWTSTTLLQTRLSIPLAVVFAPRFFAGIGPYACAQWGSAGVTPRGDTWKLGFGVATVLGTWL
jgi:hypothetical protein